MNSSIRDNEEEEELCPVCLCELSLRLKGEKPHVVPVCGHRLRELHRLLMQLRRSRLEIQTAPLTG